MRETFSYGSVEGAASNRCSYLEPDAAPSPFSTAAARVTLFVGGKNDFNSILRYKEYTSKSVPQH